MGYEIGTKTMDRMAYDKIDKKYVNELKIMEILCLEYWPYLFQSKIKNYQTNYSGSYILQDEKFEMFKKFGDITNEAADIKRMEYVLTFLSGIVRGALENLGLTAAVLGNWSRNDSTSGLILSLSIEVQSG